MARPARVRWASLLLLGLLPLTMAPRTSDGPVALNLDVLTSRTTVSAGVPVPVVVRVTNVGGGVATVTPVTIDVSGALSDVDVTGVTVRGASSTCEQTTTLPVTCDLGRVWETAVIRLLVTSSTSGVLVPAVSSPYATNT